MLFQKATGNGFIKIISTEMIISGNCKNLHHCIKTIHDRNIQRTSAKVKNKKQLFLSGIKIGCKCCSTWFIDNSFYHYTGQSPCPFCCHPLFVMKICRHGDNNIFHILLQIISGIFHDSTDHKSRQLFRQKIPPAQHIVLCRSHLLFKRSSGIFRMCDQTFLCNLTNCHAAILHDTYHTWRQKRTETIRYQFHFPVSIYSPQRVCCSKINS